MGSHTLARNPGLSQRSPNQAAHSSTEGGPPVAEQSAWRCETIHEDSFVLKSTRFLETANSTPIWLRSWRSEKHTRRCNKRGMLHEATHLHLAKSRRPMLEPRLSHFQFINLNTTCCWVAEDDNWVLTDDGVHKVAKSPAIVSWASLETKLH